VITSYAGPECIKDRSGTAFVELRLNGERVLEYTGLATGLFDSWQDANTATGKDLVKFQEGIS
jgi:hypothetical protein